MDARQQRGLVIAAMFRLTQHGGCWQVPSQTGENRKYTVDPKAGTCSCKDCQEGGFKCKHQWAVEYVIQRELWSDGTVTETQTLTVTKRKTYKQDWPAYDAAQTTEKDRFQVLLAELCRKIEEPEQTMGRPRIPLADSVFSAIFKVYSTVSGRRFACDLKEAEKRGHISKAPHRSSFHRALESETLTPILEAMITETSLPLKAVEEDFAVDSSGFTTCRYERWYDHKYGKTCKRQEWVKVHICVGVKTNIVTSVRIEDKNASDTKQLPALVNATRENFTMREVSADKVYGTLKNYDVIEGAGATPYIAFKSIHSGKGGGLWAKMYGLFTYRQDEFAAHYHKRSNIESTFSMVKRKFGDFVRSKTDVAMKNEALAKLLCHNIVCLIHETEELGITVDFSAVSKEKTLTQKSADLV